MSRTISFSDGRGSVGGFYTTIELDSRERVFVQLVKDRDRVFAKISKAHLGGILLGKTLFEDSKVMAEFASRGPQGLSAENRSRELLRRLGELVMACGSAVEVEKRFADLEGEAFYDNAKWMC